MLSLPSNTRLFLAAKPVDFRKSFDGLAAIAEGQFGKTLMDGDIFIFMNRLHTQIKILFWDRDGLCLIAKRLEKGTFRRVVSANSDAVHVQIDSTELMLLLAGVDVENMKRRKRFSDRKMLANSA